MGLCPGTRLQPGRQHSAFAASALDTGKRGVTWLHPSGYLQAFSRLQPEGPLLPLNPRSAGSARTGLWQKLFCSCAWCLPCSRQLVPPPVCGCFSNDLGEPLESENSQKPPENGSCLHRSLARSVWESVVPAGCRSAGGQESSSRG